MTPLETILRSRKDSVDKLKVQIADLQKSMEGCSLTVKPVYEAEVRIKQQRYDRLVKEVAALQEEVDRLNAPLFTKRPAK